MYWLGAIVAIGLLIIVHEAGHYVVARLCKMRVERFSLGFGPAILKWRSKKTGTLFQLAPIPFGGFVEIRGMNIAEDIDPKDIHAYPNRPAWQRFLTILAGPGTNYLFAIVLAFGLYSFAGVREETTRYYGVASTQEGYDAHGKLMPGDRILALDGQVLYATTPAGEVVSLAEAVNKLGDRPATMQVLRAGKVLDLSVTASFDAAEKRHRLGIKPELQFDRVDVGVLTAAKEAVIFPFAQTKLMVTDLYGVITGQVEGSLAGPVGVADVVKQALEIGIVVGIQMLMLLNIAVGLFNLFPLPALDGGRLVFLGYEMITRRRANPKIEAMIHMGGILVLIVVMVLVTYKDCARL